jgi:hypothetical protein
MLPYSPVLEIASTKPGPEDPGEVTMESILARNIKPASTKPGPEDPGESSTKMLPRSRDFLAYCERCATNERSGVVQGPIGPNTTVLSCDF